MSGQSPSHRNLMSTLSRVGAFRGFSGVLYRNYVEAWGTIANKPVYRAIERDGKLIQMTKMLLNLGSREYLPGKFAKRQNCWVILFGALARWAHYDADLGPRDNVLIEGHLDSRRMGRIDVTCVVGDRVRLMPRRGAAWLGHVLVKRDKYHRMKRLAEALGEFDLPGVPVERAAEIADTLEHGDPLDDPELGVLDSYAAGAAAGDGSDVPDGSD